MDSTHFGDIIRDPGGSNKYRTIQTKNDDLGEVEH